jgi:hypothetical protein
MFSGIHRRFFFSKNDFVISQVLPEKVAVITLNLPAKFNVRLRFAMSNVIHAKNPLIYRYWFAPGAIRGYGPSVR